MVYTWAAPEVTEYGKPVEFAVSKMIVSVPQDVIIKYATFVCVFCCEMHSLQRPQPSSIAHHLKAAALQR